MPEVIRKDEPIEPISFSGIWRSSIAQLYVYQVRPAPPCSFLLALAIWAAVLHRTLSSESLDSSMNSVCLLPDTLFYPQSREWKRYLLHSLWPLEPGFVRGFLMSAVLLIEGWALEHEIGTPQFTTLFLGVHIASAATLFYFRFSTCFVGIEPTLVAMAMVMHRFNPKVHTDGLDKSMRVHFAIEPRWHVWVVLSVMLLLSSNFPGVLAVHAVGLAIGIVCAVRDPDAWSDAWRALKARLPGVGRVIHVVLLVFALLFMPLTAPELPMSLSSAISQGHAFRLNWWRAVPASFPLLHMGLVGQFPQEAMLICKLLLSFACPLLLSPLNLWMKFYSGACVLLAMYSMVSDRWGYPHVGFVTLVYLAWAFWSLPPVQKAPKRS